MRTGAVAAHSAMHFGKNGWSTVGMIGLGNVARSSLLVLAAVAERPMTVKLLRYKDQAELFMERFEGFSNIRFEIVDSAEACIRNSDIIISCATYFENDIAPDEWFDEGVLVIPVHTRGFSNCDLFFDKVYADDTGHVNNFRYFSRFRSFAEVCDVVNGFAAGRESDKERILAYNIGVSVHDVYYAAHIYQMMQADPVLFSKITEADMQEPADKFWV